MLRLKQPVLKPQDLVVALKIVVNKRYPLSFAQLAGQLFMSVSEVHAAVHRAIRSHLLSRVDDELIPNKASLLEFIVHGAKYAFPVSLGGLTRGVPTSVSASPLSLHFDQIEAYRFVWPDPEGGERGVALCPLYPFVSTACRQDPKFHEVLALIDAIRGGAARERELAEALLLEYLN